MLSIPFWKLDIVNGNVLAVFMYKFKKESSGDGELRKLVALGISRNHDAKLAKTKLSNIMKDEFSRSILEVSGNMENYLKRDFPSEFKKYILTVDEAKAILPKDEIIPINNHLYRRKIGEHFHEKLMLGTKKERY